MAFQNFDLEHYLIRWCGLAAHPTRAVEHLLRAKGACLLERHGG